MVQSRNLGGNESYLRVDLLVERIGGTIRRSSRMRFAATFAVMRLNPNIGMTMLNANAVPAPWMVDMTTCADASVNRAASPNFRLLSRIRRKQNNEQPWQTCKGLPG